MAHVNKFEGARLLSLRDATGLAQDAFGAAIPCSKTMVSMMESGRKKPSEALMQLICTAFRVNRGYLEGEDVPMFIEEVVPEEKPPGWLTQEVEELAKFLVALREHDRRAFYHLAEMICQAHDNMLARKHGDA